MFVQFFSPLGECVYIFDRILKAAQDSSKEVKNDRVVEKTGGSHGTVTAGREVSLWACPVGCLLSAELPGEG